MRPFIFLAFLFIFKPVHSKVLIMTEAQVKGHVITSREVAIHSLVNDSLGGKLDSFKKDSFLEQIIKEWLLFYEATTFYKARVSSSQVSKENRKLMGKYQSSLKKLSVGPKELKEKIQRRLEAERLYTFKKKASVLPVTMGEIETEYTQNRIRYGKLTFEEAKNQIRKNKIKDNLRSRLEQWFKVLEKKYKVQRFKNNNKGND